MAIPEHQLDTWTNQGATDSATRAYRSIENALGNPRYGLEEFDHTYETHLQGSYRNHTNIYGDSDVDVVVKLTMPFQEDLTELSSTEAERFWDTYVDIDYDFWDFYSTVSDALNRYYGRANIEQGDKAMKVKANDDTPLSIDADVVACAEFRRYHSFNADGEEDYTSGMFFKTQSTGRSIVNYSKEHFRHGADKNGATDGNYKPTIRMFKNVRNRLEERRLIGEDTVPSYFVENLMYNVPNWRFTTSDLQERYEQILGYLEEANLENFEEQCQMFPLFDGSDPDRWNVGDAGLFIEGLRTIWEDW